MTDLLFSRSFDTRGGKIRVSRDDDEGVEVLFGVAEVEGVDGEPDVGAVFPRHLPLRDLYHFDGGGMKLVPVLGIVAPVRVGLLDDDLSFFQESLQDESNFEGLFGVLLETEGQIVKIDKQGQIVLIRSVAVHRL